MPTGIWSKTLYGILARGKNTMVAYLILLVTSILVGLTAMLLSQHRGQPSLKIFLAAAAVNAGVILAYLSLQNSKRRRR